MLVLRSNLGDSAACKITGLTVGGPLNAVAFRGMVVGSLQYVPISRRRVVCFIARNMRAAIIIQRATHPGDCHPRATDPCTPTACTRTQPTTTPPLSPCTTRHSAACCASGGTSNVPRISMLDSPPLSHISLHNLVGHRTGMIYRDSRILGVPECPLILEL